MTREELQKQLQDAINTANNKNTQLGGQPISSPVIRPATTEDLRNTLLDAVKTYQPAPVQPVQVTPVVQEQPKQNIFQKAGTWVSGLFKKKEGEEQDVSKSILKPILEDKYNKLDLERKSAKPRDKKIQELTKDISEIEIAMNDTSDKGMGKRILAGQKYSNERNIQQFKGAMVGLAKSTFDSIASLYEMQFKSNQDFANKQEELIRQGFKDLNIPESEQQALLEQYSPRYRKDPLRPNAPTLKETEDQIKKNIETGKEPFQKTMEKYIADVSPTNPTFADQLVQGMGSMAGFYIATILTGGGAVIPTVLESMGEAGTVYEESKKKGMPVNEAFVQSGKTFIGNLAWNAVLNKFSGLFENIGEPAIKSLKQKVLKTVNAGTWEGVQEAGQQLISNINTKKDDIWEGVLESLGLGAIIGSGAMVGEISTGKDVSPTTEVTPTTAGAEKPTEQPSGTGSGQSPEVIKDEDKEEIRTVFHGTKGENIPSILESGFRPSSEMVDFGTGVYLAGESKASDYGDLVQADIDFKKLKQYDSPLEFIEESAKFGGIDGLVEEIKKTYGGAYIKSKDTYVIYDKNLIKNIKQVVQEEIATKEATKKGIRQPQVKKNATEGIVEPKITKVKKGVATTKTKATAQKTQKMVGKSEISSKSVKSEPRTVVDHEKSIREVYKKNEEKVYDALSQVFAEMEVAEAGQRIFVEQYDSSEAKVIGISSTFPKWIPEDLRSRELFDKVLSGIVDIDGLKYPGGNRTAQRALYDAILDEVDRRSGVDTSKYRGAIIDLYDKGIKQTTKTANKRLEGRKGTPKASEEKPQTKEKQVKETPKPEPKKKQVSDSAIDEMYEQVLTPVNQKLARKAVSKENVPVGKGEVKDSALVKRMSEQLLMSDPTKYEFDDTTGKYNQLNLEEDAKKAVSFLEKNPEKAIAVSMGIIDAPAGQTANGIGIATALKARDEGNYRLYSDIINAVSLRATRMGQEIVSLRGQFNDDSAENYVKRVIDARMGKLSDDLVTAIGAVMKKTSPKKKTMERVQKETVKLKETLSKEQKKVRLAQDIIDAMRC